MRLFNNISKKEYSNDHVLNKNDVINQILERRNVDCPSWYFFRTTKPIHGDSIQFDKINCDFIAIYTDIINKEIRLKSNPFSEYKRTVESAYQIVREIYITDKNIDGEPDQIYKRITAKSAKELFTKLKNEVL